LKYELAGAGERALNRLAEDETLANRAMIDEKLAALSETESYYEWKSSQREAEVAKAYDLDAMLGTSILVRPEGHELDARVLDRLKDEASNLQYCKPPEEDGRPCYLISVDIIDDKGSEYLWAQQMAPRENLNVRALYFDKSRKAWGWLQGEDYFSSYSQSVSSRDFFAWVDRGEFETLDVSLKAVKIGDSYRIFAPSQDWLEKHGAEIESAVEAEEAAGEEDAE